MTSWILDSSLANCVAQEVHVSEATAEKVINLFEQGNEVSMGNKGCKLHRVFMLKASKRRSQLHLVKM